MTDSVQRSFIKTISWRLTGSGATFIISYIITGNFSIAGSIALLQITVNTLLYFLHERVWNLIRWGKNISID
jgi:uncharacterized membrane protein